MTWICSLLVSFDGPDEAPMTVLTLRSPNGLAVGQAQVAQLGIQVGAADRAVRRRAAAGDRHVAVVEHMHREQRAGLAERLRRAVLPDEGDAFAESAAALKAASHSARKAAQSTALVACRAPSTFRTRRCFDACGSCGLRAGASEMRTPVVEQPANAVRAAAATAPSSSLLAGFART